MAWHQMIFLENITFSIGGRIPVSEKIPSIAQIKRFRWLSFVGCTPCSGVTATCMFRLFYHLALECSHVQCGIEHTHVWKILPTFRYA